MIPFSVLDLAPVPAGSDISQAFRNSVSLAQKAEALGYHRFWLAEHHNMPGIASAATSVVIGHVAAHTQRIRVGAGGVMLPNHAPLMIAEQFGTLEALFPGRIDLGLGRAPGTDQRTMRALRRNLDAHGDSFPQDVVELLSSPPSRTRPCAPCPAMACACRSGCWVPAFSRRSSRRCWGCPSPSPRISRRTC
jgi:luciferase family oxidoreductase group 1